MVHSFIRGNAGSPTRCPYNKAASKNGHSRGQCRKARAHNLKKKKSDASLDSLIYMHVMFIDIVLNNIFHFKWNIFNLYLKPRIIILQEISQII